MKSWFLNKIRTVSALAQAPHPHPPPRSADEYALVLHAPAREPWQAALKPGGRIVILDSFKKKLPVGPTETRKLSEAQQEVELAAAGFRKTRSFAPLPDQYFLVFE